MKGGTPEEALLDMLLIEEQTPVGPSYSQFLDVIQQQVTSLLAAQQHT